MFRLLSAYYGAKLLLSLLDIKQYIRAMLHHLATFPKALKPRMRQTCISVPHKVHLRKVEALQSISIINLPYSTAGYGEGDYQGETPASEGVSHRTRELEHPGPSPPDTKPSKLEPSGPSKPSSSKPENKDRERVPPRSPKEEHNNEKKTHPNQGMKS